MSSIALGIIINCTNYFALIKLKHFTTRSKLHMTEYAIRFALYQLKENNGFEVFCRIHFLRRKKVEKVFCYGNGLTKKTFGDTTEYCTWIKVCSHEMKLKEYVKLDYARTNLFDQMVFCLSFFC